MRFLKNIAIIIQRCGILQAFKKGFKYYIISLIFSPYYFFKIRSVHFKTIEQYVDFIFNTGFGYFSPMQVRSELISLLKLLKKTKPKNILEIGTARGGTLFLLTRIADPSANLISLDMPYGKFGMGYPFYKKFVFRSFVANCKQKIHLIRADSHKMESKSKIKKILKNNKLDVLFIDGDHSYEGVKKDFEMYKDLVKKGGLIIFHDILKHPPHLDCNADLFWDEIKNKYESKEIIEDPKQGWAGIGIIKI